MSSRRSFHFGSRSGGLFYHLKAAFFGKSRWAGHRECVSHFLNVWLEQMKHSQKEALPDGDTLILVGPSGGYSLPKEFLQKFKHLIGYEPDGIARKIFEARFDLKPEWRPEVFDPAVTLFPRGVILFCNVLGQLSFADFEKFKLELTERLRGRSWASYHDAFSVNARSRQKVRFKIPGDETDRHPKMNEQSLKSWLKVSERGSPKAHEVEVAEHEALHLFAGPREGFYYWEWQITPSQTHLIEGVFSRSPNDLEGR